MLKSYRRAGETYYAADASGAVTAFVALGRLLRCLLVLVAGVFILPLWWLGVGRGLPPGIRPPWAIPDSEFYAVVTRGNEQTYAGLEEARDWWLSVLLLVGPFALLLFCYLTNGGR